MAEITISNTPLQIISRLLIEDQWIAASHRDNDYRAEESHVCFIETLISFVQNNLGILSPLIPMLNDFENIFNFEDPDGISRGDSDHLEFRFQTGTEPSYITFPGFLREILQQDRISFMQPTNVARYSCLFLNLLFILNINMDVLPGEENGGSVSLVWDNSPLSLLLTINFETAGQEVTGDIEIDWNHIEIRVRLIPRIEQERLLWSSDLELNFTPTPGRSSERRAANKIKQGIRAIILPMLEEWGPFIAQILLLLPLRPLDAVNGVKDLASLVNNVLGITDIIDILKTQAVRLDTEIWGGFAENFIHSCLLPNNPLRAIICSGEIPNLNVEFLYPRFMDHFARHIESPEYPRFDADHDYAPAITFNIEPIRLKPPGEDDYDFHDEQYVDYIVQREKYRITLDSIKLDRQTFDTLLDRSESGVIVCTIRWDIKVRHQHLADNNWATIVTKENNVKINSRIIDPGDDGVTIDWLETEGDLQLEVWINAFEEEIGHVTFNPYHISNRINHGEAVVLHYTDSSIEILAHIGRMTSINRQEYDWVRIILRELFIELPYSPIDYFFQYFGHPPSDVDPSQWLEGEMNTKLFIRTYINSTLLSVSNIFDQAKEIMSGIGFSFPSEKSTLDFYFFKNHPHVEFNLEFRLSRLNDDGAFDEEFTDIVSISKTIRRIDPEFPDCEWMVPLGVTSRQYIIEEHGNPLQVSIAVHNKLPSIPPIDRVPKPYEFSFTNIHITDVRETGDGEMNFTYSFECEVDGILIDENKNNPLAYDEGYMPHDINFSDDAVHFTALLPPGHSLVRISVKGMELDVFSSDDPMGTAVLEISVVVGDEGDTIYSSESTGYFNFQVRARTAGKPPEITFNVELAEYEFVFQKDVLRIFPTQDWTFHYGVAWAESLRLQFSSDNGETWDTVEHDALSSLVIGETGVMTITPDMGLTEGWYRLNASNAARDSDGQTYSKIVRLIFRW